MDKGSGQTRLHLIVSGRVQGVCFRQATIDEARGLGLTGWVRNRPDGRVEIVAEGRRANLEMLLAWANRGPPAARVDQVEASWLECHEEFQKFTAR
jgi:acylphosphatase